MTNHEAPPTATTNSGAVRGSWTGEVAAFLGIEYAAAPVGALRFAPPQPAPGWAGVRDATSVGPAVPQLPSRLETVMGPRVPDWAENNCLNLNVWTPAGALAGEPRPVLVWFHGGGFSSGSGGWDWYDGTRLAALGNIVVVTANYRLGPLGYLYLPELGADNLGVRDQTAVLRWVRDNIAGFGGDPGRVTVGGQSAGAYSSLLLAVSPESRDLVHQVFAQSGPWGLAPQDPAEAAEVAEDYLRRLGTSGERLRTTPVTELLAAYGDLATARPGLAPPLFPVHGGAGVPSAPMAAAHTGGLADKAVLLGSTTDELTAFGVTGPAMVEGSRELFQQDVEELAGLAATGYVYRFTRTPSVDPDRLGATHCADLPFLFGTFDAYPDAPMLGPVGAPEEALFRSFAGAVAAFVATGAPGADWRPYRPENPARRVFGGS